MTVKVAPHGSFPDGQFSKACAREVGVSYECVPEGSLADVPLDFMLVANRLPVTRGDAPEAHESQYGIERDQSGVAQMGEAVPLGA